jgi:hypothetical protein
MKAIYLILLGLFLTLIGFITPQAAPNLAENHRLSLILILCYVVGLALVIIGGIVRLIDKRMRK